MHEKKKDLPEWINVATFRLEGHTPFVPAVVAPLRTLCTLHFTPQILWRDLDYGHVQTSEFLSRWYAAAPPPAEGNSGALGQFEAPRTLKVLQLSRSAFRRISFGAVHISILLHQVGRLRKEQTVKRLQSTKCLRLTGESSVRWNGAGPSDSLVISLLMLAFVWSENVSSSF